MIEHYLQKRENLVCLFILIDLRIPPQNIDIEFINWCGENAIPFVITGTKADKISPTKVEEQIKNYGTMLSDIWEELPQFFATSSETKNGREELLKFISQCISK
jgi:GTP-binding protein